HRGHGCVFLFEIWLFGTGGLEMEVRSGPHANAPLTRIGVSGACFGFAAWFPRASRGPAQTSIGGLRRTVPENGCRQPFPAAKPGHASSRASGHAVLGLGTLRLTSASERGHGGGASGHA